MDLITEERTRSRSDARCSLPDYTCQPGNGGSLAAKAGHPYRLTPAGESENYMDAYSTDEVEAAYGSLDGSRDR